MKIQSLVKALGVLVLFISGLAFGQTQVPNTFQAGQPARAADVNDNFTTVETGINQNSADIAANATDIAINDTAVTANSDRIDNNETEIQNNAASITALASGGGIQVYSQGTSIGRFFGASFTGGGGIYEATIPSKVIWVLSDTGYVFMVEAASPYGYLKEVQSLFFSDAGCTGTAWISYGSLYWTASSGAVFKAPAGWPTPVYYTVRGELAISRVSQSEYMTGTGCVNGANNTPSTVLVLPNDEAITSVSSTAPVPPLTFGAP